ncbi:extracellular matrix regulator RemB [Alkalicoccobacillus porphyridii]|uniref:DUF370 domain-containing protein n=1 Tax=Alkalicoccobacillus porphyridii TaxID=2597270 RepID=A0A554A1J5_9BACI|nr:extracellular matrix/biofilm biosynthesis regulator RemA family protein [Alkalicoccobacillus porphyridii]TSB47545.1 DUF370 domain-containing protein [Alkalicoccobacillus porphyridii]
MFIHLGGDVMVQAEEIIAILHYEEDNVADATKTFLEHASHSEAITITPDLIKSIIITDQFIYYAPVSSSTLNRRMLIGVGLKEEIE